MIRFSYIINNENGIHARPAGLLVNTLSGVESDVKLYKDGKEANAKSLFSIMGLGVKNGDKIEIVIVGEDENDVSLNIRQVLESHFNASEVVEDII